MKDRFIVAVGDVHDYCHLGAPGVSGTSRIIYFDLDGVLADFRKGFVDATGRLPEDFSTNDMWARVAAIPGFFRCLDAKPEGKSLLASAQSLGEIRVLTAIPRKSTYPDAADEKRQWVIEHFGEIPVTIVQYAREKADYARKGDILIDDLAENVRRWVKKGGIGIQFAEGNDTTAALLNAVGGYAS